MKLKLNEPRYKNEKYENLIISKDKVRVEIIIERDISDVKTEI